MSFIKTQTLDFYGDASPRPAALSVSPAPLVAALAALLVLGLATMDIHSRVAGETDGADTARTTFIAP